MAVSNVCGTGTADDWVLDSLDRYERLHVFELQEPTLCIEWKYDETAFYVAGFSAGKHSELLQLLLPEKLLADDQQTLLARRDFKIGRGALHKHPIHHIQCAIQNNVVTSGLGPELTVWGPDSGSPDLLIATGNVTTPKSTLPDPDKRELVICSMHPGSLVAGSSTSTLQVLDLDTLKTSWHYQGSASNDTVLHSLRCLPQHPQTFISCSGRGDLTIWDSRQSGETTALNFSPRSLAEFSSKEPTTGDDHEKERLYAMAVGCGCKCACLSDAGLLLMYDVRGSVSSQTLASVQLPTRNESSFLWSQFTAAAQIVTSQRPCIQFSKLSNQLSVSALDRGIAVYDITSWSNDITDPTAIFVHGGHEQDTPHCKVTVHSWHPSFHSMIVSCDSDGIMHAWQWNSGREHC